MVRAAPLRRSPAMQSVDGRALCEVRRRRGRCAASTLDWKGDPPFADVVAEHLAGRSGCSTASATEATGYMARPFPKFASRFGAYDHLARVKEWSATGGFADEEAEA